MQDCAGWPEKRQEGPPPRGLPLCAGGVGVGSLSSKSSGTSVLRAFALIFGLLLAAPGFAREAAPAADDPVLEARVQAIAEDLRCLVCQNQNLADSHAELATDLKNEIREMFRKGMSEQQVTDFLVQRYGDFVLYRPPVKGNTWLLWTGPFLLLLGGLGVLFVKLRKRRQQLSAPLSAEDKAAAERLLNSNGKEGA